MSIKKGAVLHKEGVKIVGPDGLRSGDFVSLLPALWSSIGMVCMVRDVASIVILDMQREKPNSLFQNLHPINSLGVSSYVVIPGATIVPLLDPETFDVSAPDRNGIALVGDRVACLGWTRSSYVLVDAETGMEIRRDQACPTWVNSWDLMTKDIDDDVVSLLEVRS